MGNGQCGLGIWRWSSPAQGQSYHDRDPGWRQGPPSPPKRQAQLCPHQLTFRTERSRREAHTRSFSQSGLRDHGGAQVSEGEGHRQSG